MAKILRYGERPDGVFITLWKTQKVNIVTTRIKFKMLFVTGITRINMRSLGFYNRQV